MKRILGCILILGALIAAGQAFAFEGDRQGFILNLGAGFGQAKHTISIEGIDASFDENGVGPDLKIGAGVSPQTLVYFSYRSLFHTVDMSVTDPETFDTEVASYDMINGMSSVCVSYFLEPQAPSFFFSGGLGVGVVTDRDAEESESGLGVTLGVGYEFTSNWIVEATFMTAKVEETQEFGFDMDYTISNAMITISWLAY